MIDWFFVFTHSLWIFGLSIVLAAASYHDWLRRELGRQLRQQLRERSFRCAASAGFLLMALGFMLLENLTWWERAFCFVLGGWFGWNAWTAGIVKRAPKDTHL